MGKRRKRLTMPKYAKKYASVRAAVARLKGVSKEAEVDGVIAVEEVQQIEAAKEEVIEVTKEAAVEPVVVETPKAPESVKDVKAKSKPRAKPRAKAQVKKKVSIEDKS